MADNSWFIDGRFLIAGQDEPQDKRGFLEDFMLAGGVIGMALSTYLFRTIIDFLPRAVISIVKNKTDTGLSEQIRPEAGEYH